MNVRLEVIDPAGASRLAVPPGEVHVLVEHHAATLVAVLRGRSAAGGWQVRIDGRPVRGRSLAGRVRQGLAVVDRAPVAPDVTVVDHLAAIVGRGAAIRLLSDAPLLVGRADDPAGVLSGGERRVLAWLRARALRPAAVLLEGAAEGLDVDTLRWAGQMVAAWRHDGVAVVVRAGRLEEHGWALRDHGPASLTD